MTSSPRRSTLIALIPALVVVSLMLSPDARGAQKNSMKVHGAYVVATHSSGKKAAHLVRHGTSAPHHARVRAHSHGG